MDVAALRDVAQESSVLLAAQIHGERGLAAMRRLTTVLRKLYELGPVESIGAEFTLVQPLGERTASEEPDETVLDLRTAWDLIGEGLVARIRGDGRLARIASPPDFVELSRGCIVYRRTSDGLEQFYIDGHRRDVTNSTGFPSLFAIPTFVDLEEALREYRAQFARQSQCHVLALAWRTPKRLMFLPRPEATLRRSLGQYLKAALRGHQGIQVRPEQNVDESKPVDIKITWALVAAEALIEVKWMGKSAAAEAATVTAVWGPDRVRTGVSQLVDYLERERASQPMHGRIGYLAVFDARRRGVSPATETIDHPDGFYYADREVDIDPAVHARREFGGVMRFFIEPVCDASGHERSSRGRRAVARGQSPAL